MDPIDITISHRELDNLTRCVNSRVISQYRSIASLINLIPVDGAIDELNSYASTVFLVVAFLLLFFYYNLSELYFYFFSAISIQMYTVRCYLF